MLGMHSIYLNVHFHKPMKQQTSQMESMRYVSISFWAGLCRNWALASFSIHLSQWKPQWGTTSVKWEYVLIKMSWKEEQKEGKPSLCTQSWHSREEETSKGHWKETPYAKQWEREVKICNAIREPLQKKLRQPQNQPSLLMALLFVWGKMACCTIS